MARKKHAEAQAEETAQTSFEPGNETDAGQGQPKRPWKSQFGHWRDNVAGVRIEEDRDNSLLTIIFKEKAPAMAVKLLEERGWVEDLKVFGGWSSKIDPLRKRTSREIGDALVLEVDNIIREGKGLPPRKSFYISRDE